MKKTITSLLVLISAFCLAQVGLNTSDPQATLDVALQPGYVSGGKAGIAFPQLSGDDIEAMNTTGLKSGTVVYSTSSSTAATKDITAPGYWYWKDTTDKWESVLINAPKFFYSPSLPIDTSVASGSVDLHANYTGQFSAPMASSTGSSGSIPVYPANALEYYVTWYDNTVFSNVAIDANGKLTYDVLTTADTSKPTYMNVIFLVK